ncbi:MAG: type II secretion system protein [Ruminococcus sp.]|nr:type II secretion system protein [Ruminococcus sp.]
MKKKKGFSLIELIVVIAIISILMAILIPSWGYFIRRSRERSANAKARIIFNAAQNACTEYMQSEKNIAEASRYIGSGDFLFYWESEAKCGELDATGTAFANTSPSADDLKFGRKVNKIIDDMVVYKIYVKNYKVQSVTCSRFDDDRYVGAYPKSCDVAGVQPANVWASEMTDFVV